MAAPVLVPGCDDIYWMNHLHGALANQGYFPGDEEMESWLFADQTQSALLTFQVPRASRLSTVTATITSCQYLPKTLESQQLRCALSSQSKSHLRANLSKQAMEHGLLCNQYCGHCHALCQKGQVMHAGCCWDRRDWRVRQRNMGGPSGCTGIARGTSGGCQAGESAEHIEAKECPQAHDIASLQSSKGQPHLPCINLSLG